MIRFYFYSNITTSLGSDTASVAKFYNLALAREPSLDAARVSPFEPTVGRCPSGFPAMMNSTSRLTDHSGVAPMETLPKSSALWTPGRKLT